MPYFTGGFAAGNIRATNPGFAGIDQTNGGWTIGGGIEGAMIGNWTARAEYLYVNLGSAGCAANCGFPGNNVSFTTNIFPRWPQLSFLEHDPEKLLMHRNKRLERNGIRLDPISLWTEARTLRITIITAPETCIRGFLLRAKADRAQLSWHMPAPTCRRVGRATARLSPTLRD
jgi:hypothetical protein